MGRPSLKTPELIEAICARLEKGEPLAQICRDDGMPGLRTAHEWRETDPEVSAAFARAREIGFDAIANDSLAIIDERPEYVVAMIGDDATEKRIDSASVQWAKNRAEHRLKLLAKWDPKRYGEKLGLVGGDGEGPVSLAVAVSFVKPDKSE